MTKLRPSKFLRIFWDGIRTSLWFVPALMMAAATLLAALGLLIDESFAGRRGDTAPAWIFVSSGQEARTTLSTLLASMITMTSLVFSITMVVLGLAAQQFGPRLIRNFMESGPTQAVLGTFVMTILYCLIVLALGDRAGQEEPVAFPTVTIGFVLAAVSVGLLVFFMHLLARSIVSETIIERVGLELDGAIQQLLPLSVEESDESEGVLPADFAQRAAHFGTGAAGYVQAIEFDRLVDTAQSFGVLMALHFQPGDYLAASGRSIAVYPSDQDGHELREKILATITLGAHRTPVQDVEYPIRHLVEIAIRALSPSLNDAYTAVAVIHRLSASLGQLAEHALPPGVYRDCSGAVRVLCPRSRYETLVGAAFNPIRQSGADNPLVMIHLVEGLSRMAEHVVKPSHFATLRNHLRMIEEDAEREIKSGPDRRTVKARIESSLRRLASSNHELNSCDGAPISLHSPRQSADES